MARALHSTTVARALQRARPRGSLVASWVVTLLFAAALFSLPRVSSIEAAGPCDPPIVNPIACENSLAGNPDSEWDISGIGDASIQGFATDISVNKGETVPFKVKTDASAYRLDIYRMGYYGGMGARKVATVLPSATLPQTQPACLNDAATGLIDCGNWALSASWPVPATAVSGIYFARLVRTDNNGASHVMFVVRDDNGQSPVLFQTADTTWQAYNDYGGNSLYTGAPVGRAYKVSYNRPFTTRAVAHGGAESFVWGAEYPMVRWLEANGYHVSYTTGVDSDRRGAELLEHDLFLSVGHDEYWSATQRANVEAARGAGVHLAFFSGNEVFWKTRWESSIDGSGTTHRTLVSYKETHANAKIDPNPAWTGTWRDPRFSPPSDGGRPENALTGTAFMVNAPRHDPIVVPAADGKMRFWRNTDIATLPAGDSAALPDGVLGYEWDEDRDNGSRPAGLVRLSSTTIDVSSYLLNYGSTYGPAGATHHLTLYRHSSGALVFGAGTVQWSWGLDDNHDGFGGGSPDERMQQATVNLFADMGVQPGTLQAGLVGASASTDSAAPTSNVTSPAGGASVQSGLPVTISGSAADSGGGVVGGVEVSVDGGITWHPAEGRANWTYTWTPGAPGTATINSRAADDSGNLQPPGAGVNVTITPRVCPCTLWAPSTEPTVPAHTDSSAIEVGVKFRADSDGYATGVRFYKGSGNSGTHVGNIWTADGTLLASATFSGESATGWQQASFGAPVPISANTTYVISYFAPNGRYARDASYFASTGVDSYPLHAPADGAADGNGVYRYGAASGFPNQSASASNYWVDVVFDSSGTDTIAPTVTSTTPTSGATGVAPTTTVRATFNEAVNAGSISFVLRDPGNAAVPATVSYDAATRTVTLTPSANLGESLNYTATLSGTTDLAGNVMTPYSWSFLTAGPAPSIWAPTATPAVPASSDGSAVELGLKFRADLGGYITGVRFYKGAGNSGTHSGSLWAADGTLLASATFASETASGWQQVSFGAPVAITANTTYVVSYYAPNGHYSTNSGYFASAFDNYPLHALANAAAGGNGVYKYGASGFPSGTYNATNYWVDVVFSTSYVDTVAPTVSARTPAAGATGVPPTTTVTATFSEPVTAASVSMVLRDSSNAVVPATVAYDAATRKATLTPSAALTLTANYTATVSGATDLGGNVMTATSWSFTVASIAMSIWSASATPAVPAQSDGSAIELGLKFRSDSDGYITGVRFYKGVGNAGTHTGNLWTAGGTLLASVTFAGETASGWQQALFSGPVAITANTTYVVSYFAPVGHYSTNQSFFATSGVENWPLRALASGVDGPNGLYRYGSAGFPTSSYLSTNYWVDIVFSTSSADGVAPTVSARTPPAGATGVAPTTTVTATFSEPVSAGSIAFQLRDPGNAVVPATVGYDALSRKATLTPSSALTGGTFTATVSATDLAGNTMAPTSWTFTTVSCPCSIWAPSATPAVVSQSDSSAVELGLKFRANTNGWITGVRFYKGAANTGTHKGSLWTTSGTLLATVTFTGETASGWQQALFASPVAITANTTYVVSYHAPVGRFSLNSGYFSAGLDSGPLHALSNAAGGGNGVYRYGASAFPSSSYGSSNYWVDVVFSLTPPGVPWSVPDDAAVLGAPGGNGIPGALWLRPAVQHALARRARRTKQTPTAD